MAGMCVYKPSVKDKNGNDVESKLFNDLLHITSNDRSIAKKFYFIANNEEFINTYKDQLEFDENGEVTLKSLQKFAPLDIKKEKIIEVLNKDLKSGTYSYNEGIERVINFNRDNSLDNRFLATISVVDKNNVNISIVENTQENKLSLQENIKNKGFFDIIKGAINYLGGDISFIDEDYSKYDTRNAQRLESGLYNIIKLSKNGDLTKDTAEEAGHFAVGALGNSLLVKRLEALCNEDVQKTIYGEGYTELIGIKNPRREAAGHLVGMYINKEIDQQNPFIRLISRIVTNAKKMFYKMTFNDIQLAKTQAEEIAESIAYNFMNKTLEGNIENALNTEEVLYNNKDSVPVKSFKTLLGHLSILTSEMSAIDKTLYEKWNSIEMESSLGRLFEHPSLFADMAAYNGMAIALDLLADSTPEMINMLNSIDYNPSTANIQAKKLRQIELFISKIDIITSLIKDLLVHDINNSNKEYLANIENVRDSMKASIEKLNTVVNGTSGFGLKHLLNKKQKGLFLSFLKDIHGSEYITRAAKVLFKFDGLKPIIVKEGSSQESLEELLEYSDIDDNFMTRWLSSMADSSDAINQLVYKAKAAANRVADDSTVKAWNDIRELEYKMKNLKIKDRRLYEVSARTGELTGNYISALNWGDWESDWLEFKQQCKEEFFNTHTVEKMTKVEKELAWDDYFRPLRKAWHKTHSTYDTESAKFKPNEDYINEEYNRLTSDEKTILNEILELKQGFDDLLMGVKESGEVYQIAHTHLYRAPQFRGSTNNRIENLRVNNPIGKAVTRTLRDNIVNAFTITSEDRDYGSAATHNTLDEDVFSDKISFEKQKIKRLPLYGVNKLKNPNEITTDICSGLIQYAAMAINYNTTSSIVDLLEVGKNVLANRRVEGLKTENERENKKSYAYSRYLDFLDAQVYNLYASKLNFGRIAVSKIINTLNSLATKIFLGGNVAGATVNVLTGFEEITKEAVGGETYTVADLIKANKIYFSYLPSNWMELGEDVKNDKVSLFYQKFDARTDIESEVMNYSTRKAKWVKFNPLGEGAMLPYKTGDHFIKGLAYLAASNRHKFQITDDKGNTKIVSLFDALEPVPINKNNPKAGMKLEFKKGALYKDPKTGTFREWTLNDEVDFTNLCRITNNRMHGIYNKLDKTAFHNKLAGQALLAMKGYALGFMSRRFGSTRYNIITNKEEEGSMVTFGKVLLNMFNSKSIMPSLRAIFLPFGDSVQMSMQEMGFSVEQYRNMRRNWADYTLILILGILKSLTAKDDDDDDEEDSKSKGLAYYYSSRLFMEQNAYNTPWGIWQEQKSIADLTPVGVSMIIQALQIADYAVTQKEYKSSGINYEKGDKYWKKKVINYIPYVRSLKVLDNPYEAAKSYEYGRSTYK